MTPELILSSISMGIALISGISTAFVWIRQIKSSGYAVRNMISEREDGNEGDVYLIGILGRI